MTRATARPYRFKALRRAVSWHRRKLAVVAAVAAVLTGVNAALPPAPPSLEVVRSAARLAGGVVVTEADVVRTRVPVDSVPEGALTDVSAVLGKTLTAPVPKGQMLTTLSVVASGRGARSGQVVAPLRLADADLVGVLAVGDAVDVIAADGEAKAAAVVARGVRIVALPQVPESGGIGGSSGSADGALVLVEVSSRTATLLAQAAVTSSLSVVLR